MIRAAGTQFDVAEYRAGRQTPVFFGSALTNFGLEPFLQALVDLAPPPQPRPSDSGIVNPTDERFTGFVFKIQANMDPRHRDRVAFVRVCSGRFTKDMVVSNSRLGKSLRASRAYRFFGRDRETINVAYAGDIIGLVNPGHFAIGDTLHSGEPLRFLDLPRFPAEHFGRVRLKDTRYKQFDDGLRQLEEEGLMQVFYVAAGRREPIVGVVGALQFDVITSRLRSEYGVEVEIEPAGYRRWLDGLAIPRADACSGRTKRRRHGPAGTARAAVWLGVGAAVLPAPSSRRDAAARIAGRLRLCLTFFTCAGAPPPARTYADASPRLSMASARHGRRRSYFCSAGIDVAGPMPTICRMHSASFAPS